MSLLVVGFNHLFYFSVFNVSITPAIINLLHIKLRQQYRFSLTANTTLVHYINIILPGCTTMLNFRYCIRSVPKPVQFYMNLKIRQIHTYLMCTSNINLPVSCSMSVRRNIYNVKIHTFYYTTSCVLFNGMFYVVWGFFCAQLFFCGHEILVHVRNDKTYRA